MSSTLTPGLLDKALAQDNSAGARTLFVGLSGGLDSVVLLHLVATWHQQHCADPDYDTQLVALHAHHGLQPEADEWLLFCEQLCRSLGVTLRCARLQLQQGTEAAARQARYDFFAQQVQQPQDRLLLAHHLNDQAETVLLKVVQGRSAQGMPPSRSVGAGRLLRPFLQIPRAQLHSYAQHHHLVWQEDPSNTELIADRNYIRHRWLAPAVARWPNLLAKLASLAQQQRQQQALLQALLRDRKSLHIAETQMPHGPALLRWWLRGFAETQVSSAALTDFCAQLASPSDRTPTLRLAQGEVRRYQGQLWYVPIALRKVPELAPSYQLVLTSQQPQQRLELPQGQLVVEGPAGTVAVHFAHHLRGSLLAKPVRHGLWQAAAVAPWLRPAYPQLFAQGRRLGLPQICPNSHLPTPLLPLIAAAPAGRVIQGYRACWIPKLTYGVGLSY